MVRATIRELSLAVKVIPVHERTRCGMKLAAAAAINKINVKFFMTLFFCKNNSIPKLFTIELLPHKFVRGTKGKHRKEQDMQKIFFYIDTIYIQYVHLAKSLNSSYTTVCI